MLYLVLPPNVIIGPNWLLLVVEGVLVVPLVIDVMTAWNLSHTTRRILVLVPLGVSTVALVVGVALLLARLQLSKIQILRKHSEFFDASNPAFRRRYSREV